MRRRDINQEHNLESQAFDADRGKKVAAMDDQTMLQTMEEYHRQILDGLATIRGHCDASEPDSPALDATRKRLSAVSQARSTFVTDVVVPRLLQDSGVDERAELLDLLCVIAAKREISFEHVERWTRSTIDADWAGYCGAARVIWAMMEDQLDRERQYIIDRLRNVDEAAMPAR